MGHDTFTVAVQVRRDSTAHLSHSSILEVTSAIESFAVFSFVFFLCFRVDSCILIVSIPLRISIGLLQGPNDILEASKLAYADYVKTLVDKLGMLDLTHHTIL